MRRLLILVLALTVVLPATRAGTDCLIVLNKSGHDASFIDVATGETIARLPTGEGPHEVAVSPDGTLAVVANYGTGGPGGFVSGNTLTVIDLAGPRVKDTLYLGEYLRPHGVEFLPDGQTLAVTAEAQQALILLDLATGKVGAVLDTAQDASHMVALAPDASHAYVANIASGSVTVLDLEERTRVANLPTGGGCEGIAVTPDGRFAWSSNRAAGTLSIIDTASHEVVGEVACPGFPIRLKFTPDGAQALVSCASSSELSIVDVAKREELARLPVAFDVVDDAGERLFGARMAESPTPIGVLVHPNGQTAYVACANADVVAVVDLETRTVTGGFETGNEPDGLGFATVTAREDAATSEAGREADGTGGH